jgi:hypothetical protein
MDVDHRRAMCGWSATVHEGRVKMHTRQGSLDHVGTDDRVRGVRQLAEVRGKLWSTG